jgi:hypothetical protein
MVKTGCEARRPCHLVLKTCISGRKMILPDIDCLIAIPIKLLTKNYFETERKEKERVSISAPQHSAWLQSA